MPTFKMQRFRGGWAISEYRDGKRVSRHRLESRDQTAAAAEFEQLKTAATRPVNPDVSAIWKAYREDRDGRRIAANMGFSGKALLPHFGVLKPEQITIATCRAYTAKRRAAGRRDGTIGTELNHLRIALTWARKGRMVDAVPPMELSLRGRSRPRSSSSYSGGVSCRASGRQRAQLFLPTF